MAEGIELLGWWSVPLLLAPAALYIGGIVAQAHQEFKYRPPRRNYYAENLQMFHEYLDGTR